MRRRQFIAALGAAAAWPVVARAQQSAERLWRLGVLMPFDENDPQVNGHLSKFMLRLGQLGWVDGRNVRMDIRWAAGNSDRLQTFAQELVGLQPDVIFANTTSATAADSSGRRSGHCGT
jgi:putative tryptophan/tyrosine transport system substrate-binding protein